MFSLLSASPAVIKHLIEGITLCSKTAISNSFLKSFDILYPVISFTWSVKKSKYRVTVSFQVSLRPSSGNHLEYLDRCINSWYEVGKKLSGISSSPCCEPNLSHIALIGIFVYYCLYIVFSLTRYNHIVYIFLFQIVRP